MNEIFTLRRLFLTALNDLYFARRQILLAPVTITAFIILTGMINGKNNTLSPSHYNSIFLFILFIGGLISTAAVFRDSYSRESIHRFLTLPASHFEKFLVRFLFSTIGYVLLTLLIVWTGSVLTSLINLFLYHQVFLLFNPFHQEVFYIALQGYLAIHAPFFLGAVWFRKHNLIKTLLTLALIQILLVLISGGLGYAIFFRFLPGNSDYQTFTGSFTPAVQSFSNLIIPLRIILQGIIPLTCWTAAYFRLKERQVNDGV